MLHARTHPQCSRRSRAGSRVQLVSVVIGPTILPTDGRGRQMYEGERGKEGSGAFGLVLRSRPQSVFGRQTRPTHSWLRKGCVIQLPACSAFGATSTNDIRAASYFAPVQVE